MVTMKKVALIDKTRPHEIDSPMKPLEKLDNILAGYELDGIPRAAIEELLAEVHETGYGEGYSYEGEK